MNDKEFIDHLLGGLFLWYERIILKTINELLKQHKSSNDIRKLLKLRKCISEDIENRLIVEIEEYVSVEKENADHETN